MSARSHGRLATAAAVIALLAIPALLPAQIIISARAGMLNFTEGCVLFEGKHIEFEPTKILHLHPQQRLSTEDGYAEILLGPDVFLRMGFESEIEMIATDLNAPQVRIVKGHALIDANGLSDENPLTVLVEQSEVRLVKKGLYRFEIPEDGAPELSVWNGQAIVLEANGKKAITERNAVALAGNAKSLVPRKAERSKEDPLDTWSRERSSVIAEVNGENLRRMVEEDRRDDRFRLPNDLGILGH